MKETHFYLNRKLLKVIPQYNEHIQANNQYVTLTKITLALASKYYLTFWCNVCNFDVTCLLDTSQRDEMSHYVAYIYI